MHRSILPATFIAVLSFSQVCEAAGPLFRGQYGIGVPLMGANHEPTHTAQVTVGAIETGSGACLGGEIGFRLRPLGEVQGGEFITNFLSTWVPESRWAPFLLSEIGLGLIGSTNLEGESSKWRSTFDLMTPHAGISMGMPMGRGFAFSAGITLTYLWHVWNEIPGRVGDDQLILNFVVGFGVFDPHTPDDENVLDFFVSH